MINMTIVDFLKDRAARNAADLAFRYFDNGEVDGPVTEWTMREGETRELAASGKLLLSLGNAGVVRLTHNDRVLGFIGQKGEVKRDIVFEADRN